MAAIQYVKHAKNLLIIGAVTVAMLVPTGMALADEGDASTQDSPGLDMATIEDQYGIAPASTQDEPLRLDLGIWNTTAGSQLAKKDTESGVYLNVWGATLSENQRVNLYGIGWVWDDIIDKWVDRDCTVGTPQLRWNGKHTFRQNINEWGYSHAQITAWRSSAPPQVLNGVWSPDYSPESDVTDL